MTNKPRFNPLTALTAYSSIVDPAQDAAITNWWRSLELHSTALMNLPADQVATVVNSFKLIIGVIYSDVDANQAVEAIRAMLTTK